MVVLYPDRKGVSGFGSIRMKPASKLNELFTASFSLALFPGFLHFLLFEVKVGMS